MAQKIQTLFIDDIDGGAAEGTVRFALDGTDYEIDLSGKHSEELRDALRKFGAKAVPVASIDYLPAVINVLGTIVAKDKLGVCIRARLEHIMLPDFAARLATLGVPVALHGGDLDRLVFERVAAVQIAERELQRHQDQSEPKRDREAGAGEFEMLSPP